MIDRKQIAARAAAATPGPWEVHRHDADDGDIDWQVQAARPLPGSDDGAPVIVDLFESQLGGSTHGTALFIAAAREDVPALLAELARIEAELTVLRNVAVVADQLDTCVAEFHGTGCDGLTSCSEYFEALNDAICAADAERYIREERERRHNTRGDRT